MWLQQLLSTAGTASSTSSIWPRELGQQNLSGKAVCQPQARAQGLTCLCPLSEPSYVCESSQRGSGPEPSPSSQGSRDAENQTKISKLPTWPTSGPHLAGDACESRNFFQLILRLITNGLFVCYWTLRLFITQQELINTSAQRVDRNKLAVPATERARSRSPVVLTLYTSWLSRTASNSV